jgi:hypothetical protein
VYAGFAFCYHTVAAALVVSFYGIFYQWVAAMRLCFAVSKLPKLFLICRKSAENPHACPARPVALSCYYSPMTNDFFLFS